MTLKQKKKKITLLLFHLVTVLQHMGAVVAESVPQW